MSGYYYAKRKLGSQEVTVVIKEGPLNTNPVAVLDYTPELQEDLLSISKNPRGVTNPNAVSDYALDIDNDRFYNYAPFYIGKDGTLVDGFHRSLAASRKGYTYRNATFIFDVTLDQIDAMDSGRVRALGQKLAAKGIPNGTSTAAGSRLLLAWANGTIQSTEKYDYSGVSKLTALTFVEQHTEIFIPAASLGIRAAKNIAHLTPAPAIAFIARALFKGVPLEKLDEFFGDLEQNKTNGKGDPRSTLLSTFRKMYAPTNSKGAITPKPSEVIYMLVRSWNAYIQNEQLLTLALRRDGIPYSLPEISVPIKVLV